MVQPTSVPLALFYPPPAECYDQARAANSARLLLLKKSLSKTLTRFYPFAGRIKDDNLSIECNDEGVPFYEAFAHNYELKDVLRQADLDVHFLPTIKDDNSLFFPNEVGVLHVQVTIFECGSMCIGLRFSHKIADRASSCTFINAWASLTYGPESCAAPEFVAAAKFLPPPNPRVLPTILEAVTKAPSFDENQRITKIFTFSASTIDSLNANKKATRVEVVSAMMWKCAMAVAAASGTGKSTSYFVQNVNIRKRFVPPLPKHCIGNVVAVATACKGENDSSELSTLVACIRKGLSELSSNYMDKETRDAAILEIPNDSMELALTFLRGEIDIYLNSWCGFRFYGIDFGWGKPSWVNPVEWPKSVVFLMDSRDIGGIDAWVCFKDKEMQVFEHELKYLLQ